MHSSKNPLKRANYLKKYSRCVGGPVTLCIHAVARGVRGYVPPEIFGKNGVILCNLGRSKVCITNLKSNNFQGKNQQENLIAIFLSQINVDEHVSTKINTFRIYKVGLEG